MRLMYPILLLAVLLVSSPSFATDYYLSPNGDDRRAGTSEQSAWKSLARASEAEFKPGDRLLLQGGARFEGTLLLDASDSGTAEKPFFVGSYGNGKAHILAGDGSGILARNVAGVVIENLKLSGSGPVTNNGAGVAVLNNLPGGRKLEYIRIRRVEVNGFGRNRAVEDSLRASGCGIFVGGDPEDRGESGFRDVVIEDSRAFDNEYFGILVSAANYPPKNPAGYANERVTIRRCQAYDNPGDPEYFDNHSGSGILLSHTDEGLIEHSQAWNNGQRCFAKGGGPVGIWAWAANRITIQYCESHHNKSQYKDGGGFDFDGGVSNSVLQYNYSHDNEGTGYLLYTHAGSPYRFENNIVRHCVSRNDGSNAHRAAIWIRDDDKGIRNLEIHHNTFLYRAVGDDAGVVSIENTENVYFHHNFFVAEGDVPLIRASRNKGLRFEDDLYSPGRGGFRVVWEGKEFKDLKSWRESAGQMEP